MSRPKKDENSITRPDLKFLENKLNHWAEQLEVCKDFTYYAKGIDRLKAMKDVLDSCSDTIQQIIAQSSSGSSPLPSSKIKEEKTSEGNVNDLSDLSTVDLMENFSSSENIINQDMYEALGMFSPKNFYSYETKFILSNFSTRLKRLSTLPPFGIAEVTQLCYLLDRWYTARFLPKTKNQNFLYKADRIYEWIDMMILASGYAIHTGTFPIFKGAVENWSRNILTDMTLTWKLPKEVFQIRRNLDEEHITLEAVLLEDMIKEELYDKKFYPSENDRIRQIICKFNDYSDEELSLQGILKVCPNFTITKSLSDY